MPVSAGGTTDDAITPLLCRILDTSAVGRAAKDQSLKGSDADYSWILKETGDDGLLPQERILLEDKIIELLTNNKEPLAIKEIAEKLQTKYEYARRWCIDFSIRVGSSGRRSKLTSRTPKLWVWH